MVMGSNLGYLLKSFLLYLKYLWFATSPFNYDTDFGKLCYYKRKENPLSYCEFWTNSYCLVSSAKNSVCKLSLLLLPWQQTMPQSEKKGIQSKFSTRQVFPSTLFCTFFFPFPPSTMSSTRWTGKNKEQSFAQTLCFFNCYCFMPLYVVLYFRW